MRFLLWLVLAGALGYAGVLGALYVFQRRIVFQPDPSTPDLQAANVPGLVAIHTETSDGLALLAWYRPAQPGQPTLLYLHGNGGNIANRIPRMHRFAPTGWGLFFAEYRGYGGNPGSPSESGFTLDATAAAGWLQARGVAGSDLILYGESIGTGVATRLATTRPVAALILESPYTSIRAIAEARYPWAPVRRLTRDPFELLDLIPQVHAPVLVLQGLHDDIVPPAMGQAVHAAANPPAELWSDPHAGHNDLLDHGAIEAAIAFIARHRHASVNSE